MEIEFPEQCEVNRPVTMTIQPLEVNCEPIVFISATDFEVIGKRWQNWDGKRPVKFSLIPRAPGLQFVEIEFFHGTARVGYTVVETEVVENEVVTIADA